MKSAYQILGLSGNASNEDIHIAFEKAKLHYTTQYMAANAGALQRFQEIKESYALLKDPVLRASHDRKLASMQHSRHIAELTPVLQEPRRSVFVNPFVLGFLVIGLLFGSGTYMSWKRTEAAKEAALAELAAKKLEAAQAERERAEAEKQAAAIARAKAQADEQERALRIDNRNSSAFAAAVNARAAADAAQVQRQQVSEQRQRVQDNRAAEQMQRERDRNAQFAAQQRLSEDQARLRNLCMLNYGRPNC